MNIYKFEYEDGQRDWVFAPSKKEAVKFYLNHTGGADLDDCIIKRVPKKEWDANYIIDIDSYCEDVPEDEEDNYMGGYKIEMTFKEYAEKNTQTDIIATTEY